MVNFLLMLMLVVYCSGIVGQDNGKCPSTIPQTQCEAGSWPGADARMDDGIWLPSRSTHYGGTSGGACAFGNTPNCWNPGNPCDGVPDVISNSPFGGLYAAPQGNYYAQIGNFPDNYISCGECFEIRCVDSQCSYHDPVTIMLADSCPCFCNTKWCCANYSDCIELGPDLSGHPHCPISKNGIWDSDSIHLDLSDWAMGMLVSGTRNNASIPGIVNTMFRRVRCPVSGNLYLQLTPSVFVSKSCYTLYPNPPRDCFYYLSLSIVNVAGYGNAQSVWVNTTIVENGTLVQKLVQMRRDPNSPQTRPQEQFGAFVGPNSVALYFPINFILTNRMNETVTTKIYNNADDWPTGIYIETGVQFPTHNETTNRISR